MQINTALTMALGAGLILATGAAAPAQANPFKKLGKLIEKVERDAAEVERKAEQVEETANAAKRIAGKIGREDAEDKSLDPNVSFETDEDYDYSRQSNSGTGQYGMGAGGSPASQTYRDVEFPFGELSFADEVVSYTPGATQASEPYRNAQTSLGIPDWLGGATCESQQTCEYISLGSGGALVVQFTDNVLTGSGTEEIDLWVFEIGPDVEDMSVDISIDGVIWESVGSIGGGNSGVDIDAFGFGPDAAFYFVRLTDDPKRGHRRGRTAGADIDAIGAISTRMAEDETCTCP